jgi:tRNA modification GTPase
MEVPSSTCTIFALSSGSPPAAVAVVRISGPRARVALEQLIGRLPPPRQAVLARVRDPASGDIIDQALALWFPGPRSETGEDTAELQLHGGRAVVAAVLAVLGRLEGFRLAEPGEFTRRAFENGRIDLTQVEALADLVFAETQAQRRQAMQQLRGLLGSRAETWRAQAIEALALVEAGIDFSDEADVPRDLVRRAMAIVESLAAEIANAVAGAPLGERLREGLRVVIAGPPNAGKSTLLNRIAKREAAIVSPSPGTTRDMIEVHLDLRGYPVNLIDTAGMRQQASDPIEHEGMRRARVMAEAADLVLWLSDVSVDQRMSANDGVAPAAPVWTVLSKIDLVSPGRVQALTQRLQGSVHAVSAVTGAGIDALVKAVADFAQTAFRPEPALVTRERQRQILSAVVEALDGARVLAADNAGEELVAERLRQAATGLGRLTGRVDVEDVLDVIFGEFCIGK